MKKMFFSHLLIESSVCRNALAGSQYECPDYADGRIGEVCQGEVWREVERCSEESCKSVAT